MGKTINKKENFDVRSDCRVEIIPKTSGGIKLKTVSRVESMFG